MTKTCWKCGTEINSRGILCPDCKTANRAALTAYRAPIIAKREAEAAERREAATKALRFAADMGA